MSKWTLTDAGNIHWTEDKCSELIRQCLREVYPTWDATVYPSIDGNISVRLSKLNRHLTMSFSLVADFPFSATLNDIKLNLINKLRYFKKE